MKLGSLPLLFLLALSALSLAACSFGLSVSIGPPGDGDAVAVGLELPDVVNVDDLVRELQIVSALHPAAVDQSHAVTFDASPASELEPLPQLYDQGRMPVRSPSTWSTVLHRQPALLARGRCAGGDNRSPDSA